MLIAMVLSASAQYYMHVWSDGAWVSWPVLNVDSVTFTDGPLENVPNEPQEPSQGIGVFSVGEGRTITFAPGNLQYHPANKKWRFAEHQWDCVGEANSNISETYDGWIDLFGWGTGNNPTNISTDTVNDYSIFTDWGSNQIGADMANTWHTISYDDWYFIFILRENATSLFGLGSINGVQGAIILPDNWIKPENVDFISANEKGLTWHGWYYNIPNNDGYTHNIYTIEQWTIMELAGAVFLPATGKRNQIAAYGLYWSSNAVWDHFASSLNFTESSLAPQVYIARNHGLSVRLIKDTIIPSIPEEPETPTAGIGVFSVGEGKTVTFSPGNLQYHPANDEWRFAEHQWDYVGEANSNIAADYAGWLDLFGWGTGDCPTKASEDYTDYPTFVDWGTNAIGNDAPNTWRTLTMEEFAYIRYTRDNAAELIGIAQVNGVNGVILLPDNWSLPDGIVFKAGGHSEMSIEAYALYQTFDNEQWSKMEALGAVFIPASGWRTGKNVRGVEFGGGWWHSSSSIGNQGVLCTGGIDIYSTGIVELCSTVAETAYSVRLVKDLEDETTGPGTPPTNVENGHEYVDLGLSVKWATCNVGASQPEEYGDYFAWGETEPKEVYEWSTYKWCNGSDNTLTKYCTNSSDGTVDNKTVLEAADDAAAVNWGGKWRMPTEAEQDELREQCTWTWTTQNGVNGYQVTGPNGKSIFLPAAGYRVVGDLFFEGSYGYYRSSSLCTDNPSAVWGVLYDSVRVYKSGSNRTLGLSVRPVCQ